MDRPSSLGLPAKIEKHRNSGRKVRKCEYCQMSFVIDECFYIVGASSYHLECLLCAQCMEPLHDETFFEFEHRLYCEHDFKTLYAPICAKCDDYIIGSVIYSVNCSFHSKCFTCKDCNCLLNENNNGCYRYNGNLYCYECYQLLPKEQIFNCSKCLQKVDEEDLLIHDDLPYHAYHFNCSQGSCKKILDKTARHFKKEIFCQRCFDMKCEICFDCKTIIDPEKERSVFSMNKHWHVNHFRCSVCQQMLNGSEHFEKAGKPYCRKDFLKLIGNHCFYCDRVFAGSTIHVFGKTFCQNCYRCRGCDRILSHKEKVMEMDMLPFCKKCINNKRFQKALKAKK